MGDVSTIQRPPCTLALAAKGDQVGDLVLAGRWTNDSHNMYINSMEASFMHQLRGQQQHHHAAPDRNVTHGLKEHLGGASDELRSSEKNIPRSRDVGVRGLPEDPWARRFRPHKDSGHGGGVGASDDESGTDTVRKTSGTHAREVDNCAGRNLAGRSSEVSGQNFADGEVHSAVVPSNSCKKRRHAPSTAAGCFISMLECSDKR